MVLSQINDLVYGEHWEPATAQSSELWHGYQLVSSTLKGRWDFSERFFEGCSPVGWISCSTEFVPSLFSYLSCTCCKAKKWNLFRTSHFFGYLRRKELKSSWEKQHFPGCWHMIWFCLHNCSAAPYYVNYHVELFKLTWQNIDLRLLYFEWKKNICNNYKEVIVDTKVRVRY